MKSPVLLPTGDPTNPKPEPKRRRLSRGASRLALRCLGLAGYETYFPRLREHRLSHGRRIEVRPARVADQIIDDLRKRERNGLIELPKRPALQPGDQVQILQGPFAGQLGPYAGMRPHERVLVLLALFGGQQRVELAKDAVETV